MQVIEASQRQTLRDALAIVEQRRLDDAEQIGRIEAARDWAHESLKHTELPGEAQILLSILMMADNELQRLMVSEGEAADTIDHLSRLLGVPV